MRLTEILKPQNIKIPLESKTKTEAIRALKRHLTRVVFKTLTSMDRPTDRLTAAAA